MRPDIPRSVIPLETYDSCVAEAARLETRRMSLTALVSEFGIKQANEDTEHNCGEGEDLIYIYVAFDVRTVIDVHPSLTLVAFRRGFVPQIYIVRIL